MSVEQGEIYNWGDYTHIPAVRSPIKRVEIDNETWRDGIQGTQVEHHPTIDQKAKYLRQTARLGFSDHFDIGFPGSSPKQSDEIVTLIDLSEQEKLGLTFSAAGGAAAVGHVVPIIDVAQKTGMPLEADLFFDASRLRARAQKWDREDMLKKVRENIALARRNGLSVMFVPERASDTPPEELFEVCKLAADEGVERIGIADTRGILTPAGTTNLLRAVFSEIGTKYPGIKFDFHGHNDLDMGIANCLVAAQEGIDRLHATARGIGERAGNAPLEKLIVVLNLKGHRPSDTRELQKYAQMAADILSVPISSHEPIVGLESTATSSGIHANGYSKDINIYLPFVPSEVGLETHVRIGPMSGLSNVYENCKEWGFREPSEEEAIQLLNLAKSNGHLLTKSEVERVLKIAEVAS